MLILEPNYDTIYIIIRNITYNFHSFFHNTDLKTQSYSYQTNTFKQYIFIQTKNFPQSSSKHSIPCIQVWWSWVESVNNIILLESFRFNPQHRRLPLYIPPHVGLIVQ